MSYSTNTFSIIFSRVLTMSLKVFTGADRSCKLILMVVMEQRSRLYQSEHNKLFKKIAATRLF